MSLILLEGMDKVGKSTVAQHFVDQGYEYVHMSAPAKGHTHATYLVEMLGIISNTANKNVIVDRSWHGELIWPSVYGRESLLSQSDVLLLNMISQTLHNQDVKYYYMYDDNKKTHKARLRKFKEPSYDYDMVYNLYEDVMGDYMFEFLTFQDAEARGWISKNV